MAHDLASVASAANEEQGRVARRALARALAHSLTELSRTANVGAYIFRDDALRASSIVTEIAGELATSVVSLLEAGHVYAAGALTRQLIEAEYLVWLFSEDASEANRWSSARPAEIRQMFSPKVIRERSAGRFQASEYWTHCDLGGHPNPKAVMLLSGHAIRYGETEYPRLELAWSDLCQHLVRLWETLLRAFSDYNEWTDAAGASSVADAIENWRERDKLTSEVLFLVPGQ